MNALRAMYGLRRICLAVTSFVMSASTIHLLSLPSESAASNLSQALQDLQVISTNHQFAARCIDIIRSLAAKWNIALPETVTAASAFRGAGPRSWPSPPSSTFFAASIPRKQSSAESGSRSAGSGSYRTEGPFRPPPTPAPQPLAQPQQPPTYYGGPAGPLDPSQAGDMFWTPFPVQGVPTQPDSWNPMEFDFSQAGGLPQWPMFGGSAGPAGDEDIDAQPTPTSMAIIGDTMGQGMGDWSWQ